MQNLSVSQKDIDAFKSANSSLGKDQKRILERLNELQTTCENARENLYQSLRANPEQVKEAERTEENQGAQKTKRKDKSNALGRKKGWLRT